MPLSQNSTTKGNIESKFFGRDAGSEYRRFFEIAVEFTTLRLYLVGILRNFAIAYSKSAKIF